jgi:hypothetical protein
MNVTAIKQVLIVLPAVLALGPGPLRSEVRRLDLKWSELGARVDARKIQMVLPEGASVEGKVVGVEPGGLRLRVTKTSERKLVPKGERLVPRQSVSLVRVIEHRWIGRLAVSLGAAAATAGIILAAGSDVYEGVLVVIVPASAAAGAVGAGIGGYYIGKRLDRKVTEIRVLPGD